MARQLTAGALAAAQALETGVAFIALLTVTPAGGDALRFAANNEAVMSRGARFEPLYFELTLPADSASEMPGVRVALDNVGQELVDVIRRLTQPPAVVIEVITSAAPDQVELVINDLILRNVSWDAQTMTADLASDDVINLAWPADAYTPARFPGLFG